MASDDLPHPGDDRAHSGERGAKDCGPVAGAPGAAGAALRGAGEQHEVGRPLAARWTSEPTAFGAIYRLRDPRVSAWAASVAPVTDHAMDKAAAVPVGADMGSWAANEISKHEEVCGLRYEGIAREMAGIRECMDADRIAAASRSQKIEDKIGGAIKWVMGIVATLGVALLLMYLNNVQATRTADESDKREMRARLQLLTTQLQNMAPRGTVVVAPPGTEATTVPGPSPAPVDQETLGDAAGVKTK